MSDEQERQVEKYKEFDAPLATYYQIGYGENAQLVDGVVNPLKIDNRQQCSMTDNQGSTPKCAAYSICNLCEAFIWKKTGKLINLDAHQVYAKAKQLDHIDADGTTLECAIKAAFQLGGFYDVKNLSIGHVHNDKSDVTVELVKMMIHKHDFLHIGMNITQGWYKTSSSNPTIVDSGASLGAHAILACGYDPSGLYIQNSWGKSWGAKGFAIVPWEMFKSKFIYGCYINGILNI